MRRYVRGAVAIAALGVLGACGSEAAESGIGCTGVGARVGIGLDIRPSLAATVARATMKVCWDGACRTPEVHLAPSTTSSPLPCSGDDPDDTCGAVAVRTGGKYGFGAVHDLPKRPVEVTVVLRDDAGKRVLDRRITVTPEGVFPNGPDCGEGGPQTGIVATDGGLRERS